MSDDATPSGGEQHPEPYYDDGDVAAMVKLLNKKSKAKSEYAEADLSVELFQGRAEAFGESVGLAKQILDNPVCPRCDISLDLQKDERFASNWTWNCRHCHYRQKIIFSGDSDAE